MNKDIVKNRNIAIKHLRGKEFHHNPYENARIALKFKAKIRKFAEILVILKILDTTVTSLLQILLKTDACLFREKK